MRMLALSLALCGPERRLAMQLYDVMDGEDLGKVSHHCLQDPIHLSLFCPVRYHGRRTICSFIVRYACSGVLGF